ncbi:hypothetical protein FVB9288_00915 [Flavobacterium sp. CECT 9288]|uniref:hypothetical protein n=1 Tax=Flavobacterium sp. CECT 9288 TaxID=2845819 RepID=UPI001E3087C5|nr:hypothetical protein [Flavobacterium sp. CECT 9288]CAH0335280.1 hypothetical protein FVB9288_00915 [Flavobacterium sp. CECT 9288]
MIQSAANVEANNKTRNLVLGILFDAIGMLSFTIPLLGEFSDVVWAPLAGFLMTWMYKGKIGKVGGVLTFLEEIIPFTDFIPTFTLTWIYTYLIKNKNAS